MSSRRKTNAGHAEGDHGPKTESHINRRSRSEMREPSSEERAERIRADAAFEGKRRLVEDREQHDEAEKNSERNRLSQ